MHAERIYAVQNFGVFSAVVDFAAQAPTLKVVKFTDIIPKPAMISSWLDDMDKNADISFDCFDIGTLLTTEDRCPSGVHSGGIKRSLVKGVVWTEASTVALKNPLIFKSRMSMGQKRAVEDAERRAKMIQGLMKMECLKAAITTARMKQGLQVLRQGAGVDSGRLSSALLDQKSIHPLSTWVEMDLTEEERGRLRDVGLVECALREELKAQVKNFLRAEKGLIHRTSNTQPR